MTTPQPARSAPTATPTATDPTRSATRSTPVALWSSARSGLRSGLRSARSGLRSADSATRSTSRSATALARVALVAPAVALGVAAVALIGYTAGSETLALGMVYMLIQASILIGPIGMGVIASKHINDERFQSVGAITLMIGFAANIAIGAVYIAHTQFGSLAFWGSAGMAPLAYALAVLSLYVHEAAATDNETEQTELIR